MQKEALTVVVVVVKILKMKVTEADTVAVLTRLETKRYE